MFYSHSLPRDSVANPVIERNRGLREHSTATPMLPIATSSLPVIQATNATPRLSWSMPKRYASARRRQRNSAAAASTRWASKGSNSDTVEWAQGKPLAPQPLTRPRPPPRPSMVCLSGTEQRSPGQTPNAKIYAHACHAAPTTDRAVQGDISGLINLFVDLKL